MAVSQGGAAKGGVMRLSPAGMAWAATALVAAIAFALSLMGPDAAAFPDWMEERFPFSPWVNEGEEWLKANIRDYTRAVSGVVGAALAATEEFLWELPWVAMALALVLPSIAFGGLRLGLLTTVGVLIWGVFDMWYAAMSTLSLMTIAVILSVFFGVIVGVLCSQSDRLERIVTPILDTMQTMPSFVYLIPAIFFFGIGGPSAVMAIIIYAMPPAVRLTNLGIRQVPPTTLEAARSFGSTNLQMLFKVKIPLATPSIMMGVNQTIMMALGLAVLATFIGAGGLGDEVWKPLTRQKIGWAIEGGLAIVAVAIILDRLSQAISAAVGGASGMLAAGPEHHFRLLPAQWDRFAAARLFERGLDGLWRGVGAVGTAVTTVFALALGGVARVFGAEIGQRVFAAILRNSFLVVSVALILVVVLIDAYAADLFGQKLRWLNTFPRSWEFTIRAPIDALVAWLTVNPTFIAITKGIHAIVLLYMTRPLNEFLLAVPWWFTCLAIGYVAWRAAGFGLAITAIAALVFLGAVGLWESTMMTLTMTAVSVFICCLIGVPLGVLAAQNRTVQAIANPIMDLMQTMPAFVYLIPAIMFFGGNNTTAIIATVIYAAPPLIRLTSLGLRQVPEQMTEVSDSFGSTRMQALRKVKLPMALPSVMLGVNQAVVMALAMQVITPLVGGLGLGKDVFDAMAAANTGDGLAAGIGISLIAIVFDKLSRAWTRKQRMALGLS